MITNIFIRLLTFAGLVFSACAQVIQAMPEAEIKALGGPGALDGRLRLR